MNAYLTIWKSFNCHLTKLHTDTICNLLSKLRMGGACKKHITVIIVHLVYYFGVEGFEPSNGGTKNRCLTTWRHPIKWLILKIQRTMLLKHQILKQYMKRPSYRDTE